MEEGIHWVSVHLDTRKNIELMRGTSHDLSLSLFDLRPLIFLFFFTGCRNIIIGPSKVGKCSRITEMHIIHPTQM